ncbi:MAG: GFA family protein [Steroidobacteraceae bacterium]
MIAALGANGRTERAILWTMIEGTCHCGAVRCTYRGQPESATACTCTVCRRYAALWVYDFEHERIAVSGPTSTYVPGESLGFHFCPVCGVLAYWRALEANRDGRRRLAVNLRLAEPRETAEIAVRRVDWLGESGPLPTDGRCVGAYWV